MLPPFSAARTSAALFILFLAAGPSVARQSADRMLDRPTDSAAAYPMARPGQPLEAAVARTASHSVRIVVEPFATAASYRTDAAGVPRVVAPMAGAKYSVGPLRAGSHRTILSGESPAARMARRPGDPSFGSDSGDSVVTVTAR